MIIGSGLIATAFQEFGSDELKNEFVVFASGVSDSCKTKDEDCLREEQLLQKTISDNSKQLIYFSSVLTTIVDSPYYNHKLKMEELIKSNSKEYLIFRIPQVIGNGGNNNTLFNFLKTSIINNKKIITNNYVTRSLIDVVDLVRIVDYCKQEQGLIYLSSIEKVKVLDLCYMIAKELNKTLIFEIDKYKDIANWNIENSWWIEDAIKSLNIPKIGYTRKLVRKYT